MQLGFEEYNIKEIYWCVSSENARAVRFYDKNGFSRTKASNIKIVGDYTQAQIDSYIWYQVSVQDD